jgi:hypothetical protein
MGIMEAPRASGGEARVQRRDAAAVALWQDEGYLVVEGVLDVVRDLWTVFREAFAALERGEVVRGVIVYA